ncbi:hypothetical protein HOP50_07g49920 [Chloropicon primus]|uniref:Uncharacterized protein n=1 Tax=Chloropicon primus TaxID=1764295 RepID=A0A5B8MQ23_9CHLO|nr:hypothetical protein A3770_07p49690 [Chloropicon primus]UPR01670.1 hypothetical protein HOP50_07g49920 [Chloropicon primus]|mmetsp:Transcript_2519/g.5880  ORF Transcript_2519/g.5880 Transcript_2519/m.5880 type:complete len:494 (+) Transcript_2519:188-1669(+)|eukprot:QDZ22451.1 hypothetical protein A3770_07p49690 [Chloropicon primus]
MVRLKRVAPDVYDPTGLEPVGERGWRCIDPSHQEPCSLCSEPPPLGHESHWCLKGDPGKRNGDKKLRTLIQMSREWNSPLERAHLVHHLQNNPETSRMSKEIEIIRRKETPRLSKVCMMVLARSWGFKSCIWVRKSFRPPSSSSLACVPDQDQLVRNVSSDLSWSTDQHHVAAPSAVVVKQEQWLHAPSVLQREVSASELGATERRTKVERRTIEKFTDELGPCENLLDLLIEACDDTNRNPESRNADEAKAFDNQRKILTAYVRVKADLLMQLRAPCEACLSLLQQIYSWPKDVVKGSAWKYVDCLMQVDRFAHNLEQVFWTDLVARMPGNYPRPYTGALNDIEEGFAKFDAAALKICSLGRSEIMKARALSLEEFAAVATAVVKTFYHVVFQMAVPKLSKMKQPVLTEGTAASLSPSKNRITVSNSEASTQLTAPVLEVSPFAGFDFAGAATAALPKADCLKLLRNLSSEIVLPRSISTDVLLPLGLFEQG